MEKQFNEIGNLYQDLVISDKLDNVISDALERGKTEMDRNEMRIGTKSNKGKITVQHWIKRSAASVVMLMLLMVAVVNSNSVIAYSIYEIPVIGMIGKLVTVRQYEIETEHSKMDVTVPSYENQDNGSDYKTADVTEGQEKVIQDINTVIQEEIDRLMKEQDKLDEEYKDAFIGTGGKEEDYRKIETVIDYKAHYMSPEIASFEIFKHQTLAGAYNEVIYYTYDLISGSKLHLSDVLGKDYEESLRDTLIEQVEKDKELPGDIDYIHTMTLDDSRPFYIDETGGIIFIFHKYEIAPGAYGAQYIAVGSMQ